jgi:hypothetical protein
MSKTPQMRVSPNWDKWWRAHQPWNQRDSIHGDTKAQVEQRARQIAQNQNLELIVQKRDWSIGSKDSFWKDTFPPRG